MGIVRTLQLLATLVVAGPVALVGVWNALDGQYQQAAVFIGMAVVFVVISEYAYLRFVDKTVGRLKRLKNIRSRKEN